MGLNNTRAVGVDWIPVVVLKHLAPVVTDPMFHMIMKSFKQAEVPLGFKKVSIIPLHKKLKPLIFPPATGRWQFGQRCQKS